LVGLAGWQAIFCLNLPIGFAVLTIAVRGVKEPAHTSTAGLALPGQALAAGFLALLTFAIVNIGGHSWASEAALASAALLLGAFVVVEHEVARPMLPLEMLGRGAVVGRRRERSLLDLWHIRDALIGQFGPPAARRREPVHRRPGAAAPARGPCHHLPLVGRLVTRAEPRLPMKLGMALMGAACWFWPS